MLEAISTQRDFSGGLNTTFEAWQIGDNEISSVQNMTISKKGSIMSATGFRAAGSAASSSILGLFTYYKPTFTPANILGYVSSTLLATWQTINNGSFRMTIDGTARSFTGIDTTTATSFNDVASIIQTKVRSVTGGTEVVAYVPSQTGFRITSGNTTVDSSVSLATAGVGGTDISGAGANDGLSMITGHGATVTAASVASTTPSLVRMYGTAVEISSNPLATVPTWDTVETLGTSGGRFGALQFASKIWYCDGNRDLHSYNGSTVATISSPDGNILASWRSTCFMAGVATNATVLYYSDVDDFTNWTTGDAGSIAINNQDGEAITGLVPQGDSLIVLKERSIWKVAYTYDQVTSTSYYTVTPISTSRGCISPRTALLVSNDATALSNFGVVTAGQEAYYSGLRTGVLSENIRNDLRTRLFGGAINEDYANTSAGAYFEDRMYLSVPILDATSPSSTYVYDPLYKCWTYLDGLGANIFTVFRNSILADYLFFGASDGGVYYFDQVHSYADIPYTKSFLTKRNNLGDPAGKKEVYYITITGSKSVGSTIYGTYYRDYATEEFIITDNDLLQDSSGSYIGESYLGTNYYGGTGTATGIPSYRFRKTFFPDERGCFEYQLKLLNEAVDEPYSVDSIQAGYGKLDLQETQPTL